MGDKDLIRRLGESMVIGIKHFRSLERQEEKILDVDGSKKYVTPAELLQQYSKRLENTKIRDDGIIEIYKTDFLERIIVEKIKLIGGIGGKDLMEDVYYYLEDHPENSSYSLARMFDLAADGIEGWIS